MDTTRQIQVAVARADLILTTVARVSIVLLLTAVLVVAVVLVHHWLYIDPHWIDYDAPGVDITSEGPDGYTEAWHDFGGDDQ